MNVVRSATEAKHRLHHPQFDASESVTRAAPGPCFCRRSSPRTAKANWLAASNVPRSRRLRSQPQLVRRAPIAVPPSQRLSAFPARYCTVCTHEGVLGLQVAKRHAPLHDSAFICIPRCLLFALSRLRIKSRSASSGFARYLERATVGHRSASVAVRRQQQFSAAIRIAQSEPSVIPSVLRASRAAAVGSTTCVEHFQCLGICHCAALTFALHVIESEMPSSIAD